MSASVSLVILAIALLALYGKHLAGAWRWIYVATAVTALWFNVFVLIVQSFQKISVLQTLAPTQSEPPFLIAQGVALAVLPRARHPGGVAVPSGRDFGLAGELALGPQYYPQKGRSHRRRRLQPN